MHDEQVLKSINDVIQNIKTNKRSNIGNFQTKSVQGVSNSKQMQKEINQGT